MLKSQIVSIGAVAVAFALHLTSAIMADERAPAQRMPLHATHITARVVDVDGSPVEGAVVVTSVGGQGVSDSDGVARFAVDLDPSLSSAHVTAVAAIAGIHRAGSVQVGLRRCDESAVAAETDAGVINLQGGGGCEPEWIPTFGGASGMNGRVEALAVYDDGSTPPGAGPSLYAGGTFTTAGGVTVNRIAKWDGTEWSALGSGIDGTAVFALAVFDDGSGPALYAGGAFWAAGGMNANGIAKWDGSEWSAVGAELGGGKGSWVEALAVYDDGSGAGPALYAGGFFDTAGDVTVNSIAKWDGSTWSALGSGMSGFFPIVMALTVYDPGPGSVPGRTDGLGLPGAGSALYVGGFFSGAGGVSASRIARWDGAEWSAVGGGMNGDVVALTVLGPGSGGGSALYAGGAFTTAGGVSANRIAKWDGAEWSALGGGMNSSVRALNVFDDSSGPPGVGPSLYAGGAFTTAGGVDANRIAKWDGTEWSPLGSGMNHWVGALAVLYDAAESGGGPVLYAGGNFTTAGDAPANYIAKWQGCPIGPECEPVDLNCNGAVDVLDLLLLLDAWGACGDCSDCRADLNGDCSVDVLDLLILLDNWG
jgi:trimeric autotransporter adhesin